MPANTTEIEKRLWDAADDLRANSKLKSSEYSVPVLGLIFLRCTVYNAGATNAEALFAQLGVGIVQHVLQASYRCHTCLSLSGLPMARISCSRLRATVMNRTTRACPSTRKITAGSPLTSAISIR